ncbi:MAG: hypothetical protein ACPGVG_10930 [Mycobacterium sp.]
MKMRRLTAVILTDQYAIDGFDRLVVKRAFNVLLNATTRHKAVTALVEDLHHKDDQLWEHSGLATRLRSECFPYAEKVVTAIEEKHHPIAGFFGSDCGAAHMRRDIDGAVRNHCSDCCPQRRPR